MAETFILSCSCEHEYQDKVYGDKHRLFNVIKKEEGGTKMARCTVCKSERRVKQ